MKLLEDMINERGTVLSGNILKVDSFLNHQIDPALFMAMGKAFYDRYQEEPVTKILTLEVSGIAVAFAAATYFKVPVVFAKKVSSLTLGDDVYKSQVVSYTKNKVYDIKVDRRFLTKEDHVLIIDDFLAKGEALKGLMNLVSQAGAKVAGVGICIEKVFQEGGKKLRESGLPIYSLAMIEKFENNQVVFTSED